MKRVSGLWYIKHMGIWFLAGKDIESAFFYLQEFKCYDIMNQQGIRMNSQILG